LNFFWNFIPELHISTPVHQEVPLIFFLPEISNSNTHIPDYTCVCLVTSR
jgi:hypothetical protein